MASIFNTTTLLLGFFVFFHGVWLNGMTFAAPNNPQCGNGLTNQDCKKGNPSRISEVSNGKKEQKDDLMGSFMRRIKGMGKKETKDDIPQVNKYPSEDSEAVIKNEIQHTLFNIDTKSQGCLYNHLSESGQIDFSNKKLYENWRLCFWSIDTTSSALEIVFQNFSMNTCEYLAVGNGISLSPIAILGSNSVPGSVHLPFGRAYILFISSCQTKTAEFSLTWNPVVSECNSIFNNDYGEMHYPYMSKYNINGISDETYNNNENCSWVINSSRRLNISIHMRSTEECCDFLFVRDGNTSKSDLLAIPRGTNKTMLITTPSNGVHLQFTSDASNVGQGFDINWAIVGELDECGGTYNSESGTIAYPSIPGIIYGNKINCTWTINSSLPLDIYFTMLNTESCCDHLFVRDGSSIESPLLGKFSGTNLPANLTTAGDAYIYFQSDGNVGSTGFVLHWNISSSGGSTNECNKHLNTDSGNIQYPETEILYPDNADCTWVIVTSGPTIELNFTRFSVESCCDSLVIRDGNSSSSPLLGSYSGDTLPLSVRTTTNKAFVRFVSNGSVKDHGFALTWNTIGCGTVYNEDIGMILHPENDLFYQNLENCTWVIRAANQINITLERFDSENGFDYLYIRDGSSIGPVLGRFSGNIDPISVQTQTNVAHLRFTSDNFITRTGFLIHWNATVCGAQYNSNSGIIQYPLFDGNYGNSQDCVWIIRADYPINITFTSFDTEESDYLIVRDGETIDSPVLGSYSGSNFIGTVQTNTNSAHLHFTSGETITRAGFMLQWDSKECGRHYKGDSGVITFPQDGGLYNNNEDCVWIIETSGSHIEFSFDFFNTESYDYLIICDGNNSGSPLIAGLSGDWQSPIRTGTGQAYLRFTSDGDVVKRGFTIRWNIVEPEGNPDCSCGSLNSYQEIVGGEEVEYSVKYPWHVGMFNPSQRNSYFCGGTLISNRYVLTAAHCVPSYIIDGLQVRIGDHLMLNTSDDIEGITETISVDQVYIHPGNKQETYDNDFALLRLSKSITFSDGFGIRPICLPSNSNKDYTGQLGLSVGWGKLQSGSVYDTNTLRQVEMTILSPECRGWSRVTPSMLCAFTEGKDTCQGDSGGSLIVLENGSNEYLDKWSDELLDEGSNELLDEGSNELLDEGSNELLDGSNELLDAGSNELVSEQQPEHYALVGVVSWGIGCASSTPGVYSKVTTALNWIHQFVIPCDRRGAV